MDTNNNVSLNFKEAMGQNILSRVTLPFKFLKGKIGYEEISTITIINRVKHKEQYFYFYLDRIGYSLNSSENLNKIFPDY